MASGKKRRKQVKQARKGQQPAPAGPFRHRDGHRRHRHTMAKAIKQALAEKKALQHIGEVVLPDEDEGEDEDEA